MNRLSAIATAILAVCLTAAPLPARAQEPSSAAADTVLRLGVAWQGESHMQDQRLRFQYV